MVLLILLLVSCFALPCGDLWRMLKCKYRALLPGLSGLLQAQSRESREEGEALHPIFPKPGSRATGTTPNLPKARLQSHWHHSTATAFQCRHDNVTALFTWQSSTLGQEISRITAALPFWCYLLSQGSWSHLQAQRVKSARSQR